VRAGAEQIGERFPGPESPEREAAADAFGPADRIRHRLGRSRGLPPAPVTGAAESALDFVIEQHQPVHVAQRAQGAEKFRGKGTHTAFALDRLHHDGGGFGPDRVFHAIEPRGDVDESFDGRTESQLHFELSGRRDPAEGASVEGTVERDNLMASARCTVFAGKFVESFVRFGPAVAEKDFARRADEAGETAGQFGLRTGQIEIRGVDQRGGLVGQGFAEGRVRVAEGIDRDAGSEIEISAVVLIPDADTLPAGQRQRETGVGRNDIARVEVDGGGRFLA
jgi:hypothetical protein